VWGPIQVRGTGDAELARVAAAQRGVLTRAQLVQAGVGRGAIDYWVERGRLHRCHRGVYRLARTVHEPLGPETAAVLYCGGHGVLGDGSAAHLWGWRERAPTEVSVTVTGRDLRSRPGLRVRRVRWLTPAEVRLRHGLPVTAPATTIIDLAATAPPLELEALVAEARVRGLLRSGELERALEAAGRRPGVAAVRALIDAERAPAFTRSELERRFLALVREAGLPAPVAGGRVLGLEVDFHWPAHRLVVETDGARFHDHPRAFETDRRRDQRLAAAGWRVMRITWRQLVTEPLAVLARLAMALGAAAA
jgi:hypothetical protein